VELKRYNVKVGNRRGEQVTQMQLSAADAKARGLTDKDLVSGTKARKAPANKAAAAPANKAAAQPAAKSADDSK
jgi:hypothetical protein